MGSRLLKRISTKQFCSAFDVKPHTLRAAAKRLNIGDPEHYGRLLLTPAEILKLVLEIRIPVDSITEREVREIIRSALFNYCDTKR